MDARTGKRIRLGRLFNQHTHRTVIVAYSHGSFIGPMRGMRTIEEIQATSGALHLADGVLVSPGMLTWCEELFVGRDRPALVVHMDWMNYSRSVLEPEALSIAPLATVDEVAAAGADAIMSLFYFGDPDPGRERYEVERTARLARDCERAGIGLIVEPRSARRARKTEDESDPDIMRTYCRIVAEIGADVVKCVWKGSDEDIDVFEAITNECPVPVLLAGGDKRENFDGLLRVTERALMCGIDGVVYGRNIFQSEDPASALAAVRDCVHGPLVTAGIAE